MIIRVCCVNFYSPAKKLSKISKMEKSINLAPKLVILIVTIIILFNYKYKLQFSNQKSPFHNSQSAAGTFLPSAPPSFTKNSPPPPNCFDWFCRYNLVNRKLHRHIFLFSPTNSLNLNSIQFIMPHSPKNRAKRQKISNLIDQVNSFTDQITTSNANSSQIYTPINMLDNKPNSNLNDQVNSITDLNSFPTTTITTNNSATLTTINSHQHTNEITIPPLSQNSNLSDQVNSITDLISFPTTTIRRKKKKKKNEILAKNANVTKTTTTTITPNVPATSTNTSHQHTNEINIPPINHPISASNMETTTNIQPIPETIVSFPNNSLTNSNPINQTISNNDHISSPTTTTTPNTPDLNLTTHNNHQTTNPANMQPTNHTLQAPNKETNYLQTTPTTTPSINNTSPPLQTNNSTTALPENFTTTANSPTTANSCASPQETIPNAQLNSTSTVPAEPESAAPVIMAYDYSTQLQTVISAATANADISQPADQINAPCDLMPTAPAPTSPPCSNWITPASQPSSTDEDTETHLCHTNSTNSNTTRATTMPDPQRKRARTHRMCKWNQADPRSSSSRHPSTQTSPCHQLPSPDPPQDRQSAPGTLPTLDFLLAHRGLLAPLLAPPTSTDVPNRTSHPNT